MFIESLQLKNFRNYESLDLFPDPGTNILYGKNAQGKTNILEAVYLCGTTKSHRGNRDREMIRFGEEESHIRMVVRKETATYRVDMHLRKNKAKGVAINGVPIHKAGELFGTVNLVFFSPEDLNIIKNGPAERRRFLDLELCQLDRLYLTDLGNYHHVLNQRNQLLKDAAFQPKLLSTLDVWDLQLARHAERIIRTRQAFLEELDPVVREIHSRLSGGQETLELHYEPDTMPEALAEAIAGAREKDLKVRTTSVGPHRDDLGVNVNGIDLRKYGSQGQQRTAALSLKLAEIRLMEERIHDTPILLLDDVLSELDSGRQHYLLDSIHDIQTLITCTGLDEFVSHQFESSKVFQVVQGKVF